MIYSDRTMFTQQASPMTSFVGRAVPDQMPMVPTGGFGNYGMGGGGFPSMMGMGGGYGSPFGYGGGFPSMMGMGGGFPSPFGYGGGFQQPQYGGFQPPQYATTDYKSPHLQEIMKRQAAQPTANPSTGVLPSEPLPDPNVQRAAVKPPIAEEPQFPVTGGGYPSRDTTFYSQVIQPDTGPQPQTGGGYPSRDMTFTPPPIAEEPQFPVTGGGYPSRNYGPVPPPTMIQPDTGPQPQTGGGYLRPAETQQTFTVAPPQPMGGGLSSMFGGQGMGYSNPFAGGGYGGGFNPYAGGFSPYGGGFSPYGGGFSPYGGGFSPYGGGFSPYGGGFSPFGMYSPYG